MYNVSYTVATISERQSFQERSSEPEMTAHIQDDAGGVNDGLEELFRYVVRRDGAVVTDAVGP